MMIRVIIAGVFIVMGLYVLGIATVGIFRLSRMLNRMHVAAKCDTMGAALVLTGLIILSGWNITSLKLGLVIVFLWIRNPAASHLVSRAEVMTNPELNQICDFVDLTEERRNCNGGCRMALAALPDCLRCRRVNL